MATIINRQDASKDENKENAGEYMISADPSKYVTLPVQNEKIWDMYQTTLDKFWTVHDVYIVDDKQSMESTFNEEQRHCILELLAFLFTTHYTTINKELFMELMGQVDIKEASYFFGSQADTKKTHSMMYSMLLDELVNRDKNKKETLISDVIKKPSVRSFLKWSISSTTSNSKSFSQRLLAFATLQGIVFAAPFVLFSWLRKQHPSMMPGLVESNKLIWRDENLHLSFSCMLFQYIDNDLTEEEAHTIIKSAVSHAKELFSEALPVSTLGMECQVMDQFIEYSADRILSDIHFSKLYNHECPFDWVEEPVTQSNKFKPNVVIASYDAADFNIGDDF